MDVKDKIMNALLRPLKAEYVQLDDDDGISGFVVSRLFQKMDTLDRQLMIDEALQKARLTQDQRRNILMIAGLTPEEYDAVGVRIRVHKVKDIAPGEVEVLVHGGWSDAEYVRGALNNQKGVQTTVPHPSPGAPGVMMSFRVKGSTANPLTREKVMQILGHDKYIEVMAHA
jgi:hypothetical protein